MGCTHWPQCPEADTADARAARLVADHWEPGWALLCNGLVVFDDGGALIPAQATRATAAGTPARTPTRTPTRTTPVAA